MIRSQRKKLLERIAETPGAEDLVRDIFAAFDSFQRGPSYTSLSQCTPTGLRQMAHRVQLGLDILQHVILCATRRRLISLEYLIPIRAHAKRDPIGDLANQVEKDLFRKTLPEV